MRFPSKTWVKLHPQPMVNTLIRRTTRSQSTTNRQVNMNSLACTALSKHTLHHKITTLGTINSSSLESLIARDTIKATMAKACQGTTSLHTDLTSTPGAATLSKITSVECKAHSILSWDRILIGCVTKANLSTDRWCEELGSNLSWADQAACLWCLNRDINQDGTLTSRHQCVEVATRCSSKWVVSDSHLTIRTSTILWWATATNTLSSDTDLQKATRTPTKVQSEGNRASWITLILFID
jgi:hypothetical protein